MKFVARFALFLLLSFWVIIACFNTIYNLKKAFSEDRKLVTLTDSQKKYLIFGNIYLFLNFLQQHTPNNATILLYPHSEELFYRGAYDEYPRTILTAKNLQDLKDILNSKRPEYIATWNTLIKVPEYQQIASFSAKNSQDFGVLYKRK